MNSQKLNFETTFYALALALALFLRLLNLGQAALNEFEAGQALGALQMLRPQSTALAGEASGAGATPQPAYAALTALGFALMGDGNLQARFWPALAGAFLVLLPACFWRELGRAAALVMAFGLAVDPGLVVLSRQAGGTRLALSSTLLAIGLWHIRRPALAGVLGGMALLCGPAFLHGALGLALAWGITRLARRGMPTSAEIYSPDPYPPIRQPETVSEDNPLRQPSGAWKIALIAAGVTFVLGGIFFGLRLPGLSAAFAALPAYLGGWLAPATVRAGTLLAALLVFEPFILIFSTVAVGRWVMQWSQDQEEGPFPLMPLAWATSALLLALLYPGRQPADLAWAIVPLWALAALGLAPYLPTQRPDVIALLQAGLVFVLATLFWSTLVATNQIAPAVDLPVGMLRLAILGGLLLLGALTTGLVALGWSWPSSRDGLVWGLTAAFAVYSTAALWGAAQLRPNQPQELWSQSPGTGQVALLLDTLRDLSQRNTGMRDEIEVASAVDAASLRWALRNFKDVRFAARIPPDEQPAVILARKESETPALASAYRGQDFVWWVHPAWNGILPDDLVSWLTFRQAPLANDEIILWARSDLFSK
jgi:hypothetical protein